MSEESLVFHLRCSDGRAFKLRAPMSVTPEAIMKVGKDYFDHGVAVLTPESNIVVAFDDPTVDIIVDFSEVPFDVI